MGDSGIFEGGEMRYYGDYLEENPTRCIAAVWHQHHGDGRRRQCLRKRGHGPDGLYCGSHAKRLAAGKYVNVPEDRDE